MKYTIKKRIIISIILIALMELVFYAKLVLFNKDLQEQRKAFLENQNQKATDCARTFKNKNNNGLDVKG